MRFSGTNESDFIKLRSHENTTSSSVGERTETGRERAGAADPGRRANSMHAAAEAASLSGGVAAGGGTTPLKPTWAGVEEKVSPRCTQKAKEIRSLAEHFKKVPDFRSRIQSYPIWSLLWLPARRANCTTLSPHRRTQARDGILDQQSPPGSTERDTMASRHPTILGRRRWLTSKTRRLHQRRQLPCP